MDKDAKFFLIWMSITMVAILLIPVVFRLTGVS